MAFQQTYYAIHEENTNVPAQNEWYDDIQGAKQDAVLESENFGGSIFIVTEIKVTALFATKATISLEAV